MPKVRYLKTPAAAARVIDHILIHEKPVVAVRCLGCNVGEKGGRITLVVIGCWDGNVFIFDTYTCPAIMYDGGVMRLLQSAEFLKVFHNCSPDSATLLRQFDVRIKHFFDTQIAHALIMEHKGLSPRRLTFEQICEVHRQSLPLPSTDLKRLLGDDMNVWARRPCTKEMLALAASYVTPIVPYIFMKTDRALPHESNEWFMTQCDVNSGSKLPKMITPGPLRSSAHSKQVSYAYCCSCDNCSSTIQHVTSTTQYP